VLGTRGSLILKISSLMAKIIAILSHHQRMLLPFGKPSDWIVILSTGLHKIVQVEKANDVRDVEMGPWSNWEYITHDLRLMIKASKLEFVRMHVHGTAFKFKDKMYRYSKL
jgi:hypothetical protein